MSRCLSEYTLVMVHTGEGTEREVDHLSICQECARRYQDLVRDWQRIEQIFHQVSPPQPTMSRLGFVTARNWLPRVAALATALVFVFTGTFWWRPVSSVPRDSPSREEVIEFFERTVVPTLSADMLFSISVPPTPVSDVTYIQAALDGEWPCEEDTLSFSSTCEIHIFSPLLGG